MNFWNISIPALTLLAPAVTAIYFLVRGASLPGVAPRSARVIFTFLMVIAAVGIAKFDAPVRLEFLWPFATEPSGYFEFTLQLHWPRFVWIFFGSAILMMFSVFDGPESFEPGDRVPKLALLMGISISSSLAYLSENVFLSVIFIEMTVFLLYAFGILSSEGEENQERISYFKRSGFLFLALLAILCLSLTRRFDLSSILLLSAVLYVIAFLFSRHSFPDWRYLGFSLLQLGTIFFLVGRLVTEEMSQDLFLPLATVFGLIVAIFSALSLLSIGALRSSFWIIFSFVGYLLFLRFASGRHGDQFWGAYEAVALLAALAIGNLLRFGQSALAASERLAAFTISALLLAIVAGALPGVDIAGARVSTESTIKLVALGVLTFFLALSIGKALAVSFLPEGAPPGRGKSFLAGILPALVLLLLQIMATIKMTELYGESPFRMGPAYLLTSPHIMVASAAIFLGLLGGYFIGRNQRFAGWSKSREITMEEFFPRIDPALVNWSHRAVVGPRLLGEWVADRSSGWSARAAQVVQGSDRSFFGEGFYRGFRHYVFSVSKFTNYIHSGSVRVYVFVGVVITLVASAIFLVEGR